MNQCLLCERYVREHRRRPEGPRVFDRHTVLPFSAEWCAGGNQTMETTRAMRVQAAKIAEQARENPA